MRAKKRKRDLRREPSAPPQGVDVGSAASQATYIGSPEHKVGTSGGVGAHLRSDASVCPSDLHDLDQLTSWLRDGIRTGRCGGVWEAGFPRYVWVEREGQWFEGRLTNRELGEYKGYPLAESEAPDLGGP